jgi:hypothetical protein
MRSLDKNKEKLKLEATGWRKVVTTPLEVLEAGLRKDEYRTTTVCRMQSRLLISGLSWNPYVSRGYRSRLLT